MTNTVALFGVVGLALVVGWGIRFGFRWARAGQLHDAELAALDRDQAVCDAADMASDGEELEITL